MSIATFSEPIEADAVNPQGRHEPVMLLAVASDGMALVVDKDGFIKKVSLNIVRTKWRWDADLQDWADQGGPSEIEEPEVPSGGPD